MNDTLYSKIKSGEPVFWRNPEISEDPEFFFTSDDIRDAEERLERFAPWIALRFPETAGAGGIIESPLSDISNMAEPLFRKDRVKIQSRLLLKRDDSLPISGSVKARGGIYAVLKHTEELLLTAGLLFPSLTANSSCLIPCVETR